MRRGVYNILKGKFLIDEDAIKNWQFILFCTLLAMVMIASSHSAERKVHKIAGLEKNVRQLRSHFVDQREQLMQLKMESNISERLKATGISISDTPPIKIIVQD